MATRRGAAVRGAAALPAVRPGRRGATREASASDWCLRVRPVLSWPLTLRYDFDAVAHLGSTASLCTQQREPNSSEHTGSSGHRQRTHPHGLCLRLPTGIAKGECERPSDGCVKAPRDASPLPALLGIAFLASFFIGFGIGFGSVSQRRSAPAVGGTEGLLRPPFAAAAARTCRRLR